MGQDKLCVESFSINHVLTGGAKIGKGQNPRNRKAPTKIDFGILSASFGLLHTENMGKNLKLEFGEGAVTLDNVHAVAITAVSFKDYILVEVDGSLAVPFAFSLC